MRWNLRQREANMQCEYCSHSLIKTGDNYYCPQCNATRNPKKIDYINLLLAMVWGIICALILSIMMRESGFL